MTQISRPQPGHNVTYPDAGPYSADDWADKIFIEQVGEETGVTTAGRYTRGPYASYLNRLAVTDDGADVTIDTGAGLVNGHTLINDAAVTISPTHPAANPRVDRVIMIQNNTNAVYNTNLDVPAAYAAGIPAYSTRLAILRGVEGAGVPRAMINNANYWMVELAEYDIAVIGTITNLTDFRDYVDAMPCRFFVGSQLGWNETDSVVIFESIGVLGNVGMPTAKDSESSLMSFAVPENYIDALCITPVLSPSTQEAANDVRISLTVFWSECDERIDAHSSTHTVTYTLTFPAPAQIRDCVTELTDTITPLTTSDIVVAYFERIGTNINDTYTATLYFLGILVDYLGYRR